MQKRQRSERLNAPLRARFPPQTLILRFSHLAGQLYISQPLSSDLPHSQRKSVYIRSFLARRVFAMLASERVCDGSRFIGDSGATVRHRAT